MAEKLLQTGSIDRSEILSKNEFDELHGVSEWYKEELKRYGADTTNYPEERLMKLSWIHSGLEIIDEELQSEVPSTGTYWTYTQERTIAPLEVITRGRSNYYIKLVDAYTNRDVFAFFVRGGDRVELDVPLGTYEMRYATGSKWYGNTYLFGSNTSYHRADDRFIFRRTGYQVSGYTVELFLRSGGNLRTETIDKNSF